MSYGTGAQWSAGSGPVQHLPPWARQWTLKSAPPGLRRSLVRIASSSQRRDQRGRDGIFWPDGQPHFASCSISTATKLTGSLPSLRIQWVVSLVAEEVSPE